MPKLQMWICDSVLLSDRHRTLSTFAKTLMIYTDGKIEQEEIKVAATVRQSGS